MSNPPLLIGSGPAPSVTADGPETAGAVPTKRKRFSLPVIPRTILSLGDQALVSGTSFATTILMGRGSTPHELGLYALAMSLVLFGRGFQEQLICAPYMIGCQDKTEEELPGYTGSNVFFEFLVILAATFALVAYGVEREWWSDHLGLERVPLVLGFVIPFLLLRDYLRHLSFARFNFRSLLILDGITCVIQLSGLAWLWRQDDLRAVTGLGIMGAANALVVLIWFLARSEPWKWIPARFARDWRECWSFGKWALASFLVNCAAPLVMPWVMAFAINPEAAGRLAACTSLVGLANTFVLGVCNYLSPKAAKAYADEGLPGLTQVLRDTAMLFSITIGGLVLVMLVAGELLAQIIYGPAYAGSGVILMLLSVGVLFNSLGIVFGNGLWAVKQPAANFRADAVTLGASVVAAVLLVPLWGVLGAACVAAIGPAAGGLVRAHAYRRVTRQIAAEVPA